MRVDNIETLQKIHDSSNSEDIKNIIKKNYILNENNWRDSKKGKDYEFIEYLCKTYPNYDGYISDMVAQDINWLNAEMAICNPSKNVKLNKQLKGMKSNAEYERRLKARLLDENDNEKRKSSKRRVPVKASVTRLWPVLRVKNQNE